jgi:hypothetical protein
LETPATLASSSTLKHEKHLRRPRADAPDPRNHGDDLVVALAAQPSRIKHHRPVPHLRRQIPQGRRLVGGQAHGQQRLRSKRQEPLRGDLTAERGDQAPMDGACRRAGQLLVQDRADQSRDVRLGRRFIRTGPAWATSRRKTGSRSDRMSAASLGLRAGPVDTAGPD